MESWRIAKRLPEKWGENQNSVIEKVFEGIQLKKGRFLQKKPLACLFFTFVRGMGFIFG